MRTWGLTLSMACAALAASCTENDPCSGIYYTEGEGNVSYVSAVVDGPGLGSEWWEPRVSLWDYPDSAGYPMDEITLTISQAACPNQKILIEGNVRRNGTLYNVTYCSYWLDETCYGMPEARSFNPVSDGSVTYERDDGYMTISFNNLRILNRLPADPPGVESITLNSVYRAPVTCLLTP